MFDPRLASMSGLHRICFGVRNDNKLGNAGRLHTPRFNRAEPSQFIRNQPAIHLAAVYLAAECSRVVRSVVAVELRQLLHRSPYS